MCLIRSMFLEEECVQICTIIKTSQKVFTYIGALSVITYDIGHSHHMLVLLV